MENNNKTWIIYMHRNKINGKVYIGQTCQTLKERCGVNGKRYTRNQTYFSNAIKKYGWENFDHIILENNILSREKANERESYWITFYKSNDFDYGYNMTSGGEGFTSSNARELTKKNWVNTEYKQKFCKKIICINTGEIFSSIKEASEKTGINKSSISKCCTKVHKSAGRDSKGNPIVWDYYDENYNYNYQNKNTQKVICTTTGEIFSSVTSAAKKYNISTSCISECCSGKQKTAGEYNGKRLVWEYYIPNKKYSYGASSSGKSQKKVICLNNKKIYNSLKEAGEDVGISYCNISACCHGRNKSAGKSANGEKLKWKFLEDFLKESED